jgi:lipoic acid synthetase
MTLGQYLQPDRFHLPIQRYYTPEEFARLKEEGEARGFKWVESGPLVRSSYHADGQAHLIARDDIQTTSSPVKMDNHVNVIPLSEVAA